MISCFYCKHPLTEEQVTMDHVNARCRYSDKIKKDRRNGRRVICCWPCNQAKGNLFLDEFAKTLYYDIYCSGKEKLFIDSRRFDYRSYPLD